MCTGDWKGCKCGTSSVAVGDSFFFGNDWSGVQNVIKDFDIDGDSSSTKDIPDPTCSSTSGGENNLVNMETDFWKEYISLSLCLSQFISNFKKTVR